MSSMNVRGTGGLDDLAKALAEAQRQAVAEGKKVVGRGCLNIKKDWQARWRGLTALGGISHTINYDVRATGSLIRGEVGPDHSKGAQAPLAHIPEYGLPQTPPRPGGAPALDAELPNFERFVGELGERLLS